MLIILTFQAYTSRPLSILCSRTPILYNTAAEAGSKCCSGPGKNNFRTPPPPPNQGDPARVSAKTKQRASYTRWPLAASCVNTTKHYLVTSNATDNEKNICYIAIKYGTTPPSRPPGSGNSYRPLPPNTHTHTHTHTHTQTTAVSRRKFVFRFRFAGYK
jgi:hypothetical protein